MCLDSICGFWDFFGVVYVKIVFDMEGYFWVYYFELYSYDFGGCIVDMLKLFWCIFFVEVFVWGWYEEGVYN